MNGDEFRTDPSRIPRAAVPLSVQEARPRARAARVGLEQVAPPPPPPAARPALRVRTSAAAEPVRDARTGKRIGSVDWRKAIRSYSTEAIRRELERRPVDFTGISTEEIRAELARRDAGGA